MKLAITILALGLMGASCASKGPKGRYLGGPPENFEGFPSQALEGVVYAKASFEVDQKQLFGADLIKKRGIVPVRLTIQLSGKDQEDYQILLNPERMDPRLYLLDGTPLNPVDPEQVAKGLKDEAGMKIRRSALRGGLIGSEATQGHLYFQLASSEGLAGKGSQVTHTQGGLSRTLDLTHSLLSFNVTDGDTQKPFYVGIQR